MTKKQQAEQAMWETWFVISCILFGATFFIGTLENSRQEFPNLPIAGIITVINLAICVYYGTKK